jgi:hypothetical protein
MRRFLLGSSALFLSGCAVTSFAPPIVDMQNELRSVRNQTSFNAVCTPQPFAVPGGSQRDVEGALRLINNYILTYRCQRDRAAEGRQFFEVPGFLATAGGAIAAAFGAPTAVAIGSGAASAVLGQGKSYYAPKDKAVVLSDGLRGMLCIHNEAVGIDAPTLKAISDVQETSGTAVVPKTGEAAVPGASPTNLRTTTEDGGSAVYVSSERQYFNMISTALWSVEQVVAERLSNAGKQFDMSGVLAELEKLKKEVADKEEEAGTPEEAAQPVTGAQPPQAPAGPNVNRAAAAVRTSNFFAAKASLDQIPPKQVGLTMIQLKTLKPKLDQCVVQSKV